MSLQLNGTDGVTFNDGSEQWAAASPIGTKNLIINGNMQIAQRGTSATGLTDGGYRTVDRFLFGIATAGTWTMTQDTDVPSGQGFANSAKMSCTTANASLSADSFVTFQQRLEGQNVQYLKKGTANAESVTLSFWVKSNKTGTYIAELSDRDNTRQISKSFTINNTNTWEKKTITYEGDTTGTLDNDNDGSLWLLLWLSAGTNYTSGTLATSWESTVNANRVVGVDNYADSTSNYINITGVQLEVGDTATPFEVMPYDMNLARCQRYYYKATTGTLFNQLAFCNVRTTTSHYAFLQLPVTMRANPSSVDYSAVGIIAAWGVGVTGLSSLTLASAAYGAGQTQVLLDAVTSGAVGTVGQVSMLLGNNNAAGYVALNAEL